jgi:hypothetical protein
MASIAVWRLIDAPNHAICKSVELYHIGIFSKKCPPFGGHNRRSSLCFYINPRSAKLITLVAATTK